MFLRVRYLLHTNRQMRQQDGKEYRDCCDRLEKLESRRDRAYREYQRTKGRVVGGAVSDCYCQIDGRHCFDVKPECDMMRRLECRNMFDFQRYVRAEGKYIEMRNLVREFWAQRYKQRVN